MASDVSKALTPGRYIPVKRQLQIYEKWIATENVEAVAEDTGLSPTVVQHIIDRVPRELIPLTQLRSEEVARKALDRLEELATEKKWSVNQCLRVINTVGTHFGRLLAVDTPMVQNNTMNVTGDNIVEAIRKARENGEPIDAARGNGNRISQV